MAEKLVIYLQEDEDNDIKEWSKQLSSEQKSHILKKAIREYMAENPDVSASILQKNQKKNNSPGNQNNSSKKDIKKENDAKYALGEIELKEEEIKDDIETLDEKLDNAIDSI